MPVSQNPVRLGARGRRILSAMASSDSDRITAGRRVKPAALIAVVGLIAAGCGGGQAATGPLPEVTLPAELLTAEQSCALAVETPAKGPVFLATVKDPTAGPSTLAIAARGGDVAGDLLDSERGPIVIH